MIGEILYLLSSGILGIFLGAQICEGALLVPHWKSLSAEDFFEMHKTYGKKIYQFFAPLTIVATIIPISTAIFSFANELNGYIFSALMGLFTLLFFSTYFLFFKQANKRFADASIASKDLPKELDKWANWHWCRVVFEFIAFVFSLLGLLYI